MGWEPETVLTTNLNQIALAIEGKVDFIKKTNPFGSGEESEEEKLTREPPNPEIAMKQFIQFARRRQMRDSQFKSKSKTKRMVK